MPKIQSLIIVSFIIGYAVSICLPPEYPVVLRLAVFSAVAGAAALVVKKLRNIYPEGRVWRYLYSSPRVTVRFRASLGKRSDPSYGRATTTAPVHPFVSWLRPGERAAR